MARIPLVTEFESRGIDRAVKEFKRLEKTSQKVGFALKKAFLPATAALGGLTAAAGLSLKAAAEDSKQQAELARQLKATTQATDSQVAAVENFIAKTELAVGVTDSELRPAFANLVRATGDVTKAQDIMSLALDVSAATGQDLEGVTEKLQEALQGNVQPLKELDKSLTGLVDSGADTDQVFAQLSNTFGGAAAQSADTVEGKFRLMKIQLDNTKEAIGKALLPILERLLPVLERMATFVSQNTELLIVIGAVIGTLAATIVTLNGALKLMNTLQALTTVLNTAMAKSAIFATKSLSAMWVATGVGVIVAIIAAMVILQAKFNILGRAAKGIKIAFQKAWSAIKHLINGAIDGINQLIKLINLIPGIDIPQIPHVGEQARESTALIDAMGDALHNAALRAEYSSEPMGRFETSVRNVAERGDDMATTLGRVNVELDPLNQGIKTATQRLDEFFSELDRESATDKFIEDIRDIEKDLAKSVKGSDAFMESQREAYEAVRQLRRDRTDLSDAFFETLIIKIDQGNLPEVANIMENLTDLGGLEIPVNFNVQDFGLPSVTGSSPEVMFESALASAEFGARGTTINVGGIYMPAGTDGDDVVQQLLNNQRYNGALPLVVDGATFR